jgi:hypothetical protein
MGKNKKYVASNVQVAISVRNGMCVALDRYK